MFPRLYKPLRNQTFFLFGPRGTGKTTWLKNTYPESPRIDLLDSETARLLLSSPKRLEQMADFKKNTPVIIDEIQKIPALLDEVHRLIEEKKYKFILTGSSARKLRRGGANLLAGRAYQRFFFPLTCWELGGQFNLQKALTFGLLPDAWNVENARDFLSAYAHTYLKEEVFAEGLTRNLGAFTRFLELSSFSQAQPLTLSTLASDVGVDAKTLASYLEILEDLLLSVRIPVFAKRAKRRLAVHPKFFLFDSGLYQTLRPKGPLDHPTEIDGASLETLFFHHHRALGEFTQWEQQLYYWRTSLKFEVDFVSYGPLGLFAFEIKRGSVVREDDLKALKLFKADYPVAHCFLLYGGSDERTRDGIQLRNFESALVNLPTILGAALPQV